MGIWIVLICHYSNINCFMSKLIFCNSCALINLEPSKTILIFSNSLLYKKLNSLCVEKFYKNSMKKGNWFLSPINTRKRIPFTRVQLP